MTEFERFMCSVDRTIYDSIDLETAKKIWDAAQRAAIRTISNPPVVPVAGQKIKTLGLCHPNALGKIKEVVSVTKDTIDIIWMETKTESENGDSFSSGILSEVEIINGC